MTSKEALERLLLLARPCAYEVREHRNSYCDMLEKVVQQDLDRLEQLEKIFGDKHICEIKARFNEIECDADKCDNCPLAIGDDLCFKIFFEQKWELQEENQDLREKLNTEEECCVMIEKTVKNLRKVISILQTNFFIDLIEREKDYKLGFAPKNEIKEQPRFCELDKETGEFLEEFFMNKYQKALNNLKEIEKDYTFSKIGTRFHVNCDELQELIDRNQKLEKTIQILKEHNIRPIHHLYLKVISYNEYNSKLNDEEAEILFEVFKDE